MGLFDLADYFSKKQRADESATAPRAFPVVLADVLFDGRRQTLRFEPLLFDGGHVFISFRPKNAAPSHDLIAGGGNTPHVSLSSPEPEQRDVPEALVVEAKDAFKSKNWLSRAVQSLENGQFGRLRVEETADRSSSFYFHFYGSTGAVVTEDYQVYLDGHRGWFNARQQADYDPSPPHDFWAGRDAAALLMRLDADEFAAHLEREQADPNSVYGVSSRWDTMSFEEKHALLPDLEKQIEREIVPLMRAVVWSDPSLGRGGELQGRDLAKPFWRRPRFWVKPDRDRGEVLHLDKRFDARIAQIWPHIAEHFCRAMRISNEQKSIPPCCIG